MIDVRTLPIEAQEKWKQLTRVEDSGLKVLTDNQRRASFAMETAIMVWLRYREDAKVQKLRKSDADARFMADLQAGIILQEEKDVLTGLSIKTLYRNQKKWELSGRRTSVLAPDRSSKRGRKPIKSDAFYMLANTWILKQPATKASHLYYTLVEAITANQPKAVIPSYSTFLKYFKVTKERQAIMIAGNLGKKTQDNIMPYVHRTNDALPGDIWQYDGYRLKNMVLNPYLDNDLIRPLIAYFHDVSTELVVGWSVSFSERSDVIASAFKHGVSRHVAPRILQPDNPAGMYVEQFCAKQIVERETRKKYTKLKQRATEMVMKGRNGIFFDCGVEEVKFVTPGNSKGKKIEPAHFRIFRSFETQPRFADSYVGKGPEDRPERLKRTNKAILADPTMNIPTWDWYVAELEKHIEAYNNRKKKILQNFSSAEAYAQMEDRSRMLSSEELQYKALWLEEKSCRNGYVKLYEKVLYRHGAFSVLKKVTVGYDVADLRTIRVFGEDGRELETPAVMVIKGAYMDDVKSAEAIRANRTYRKEVKQIQNEILLGGYNLKNLSKKELAGLLNRDDISSEQKDLVHARINEQEKYPEFGLLPKIENKPKRSTKVETIEAEIPDLDYIINADFEEVSSEEVKAAAEDAWLDELLEGDENMSEEPEQFKPVKNEIDSVLKRLGIGGK